MGLARILFVFQHCYYDPPRDTPGLPLKVNRESSQISELQHGVAVRRFLEVICAGQDLDQVEAVFWFESRLRGRRSLFPEEYGSHNLYRFFRRSIDGVCAA